MNLLGMFGIGPTELLVLLVLFCVPAVGVVVLVAVLVARSRSPQATLVCKHCGAGMPAGAHFCPDCGKPS